MTPADRRRLAAACLSPGAPVFLLALHRRLSSDAPINLPAGLALPEGAPPLGFLCKLADALFA